MLVTPIHYSNVYIFRGTITCGFHSKVLMQEVRTNPNRKFEIWSEILMWILTQALRPCAVAVHREATAATIHW